MVEKNRPVSAGGPASLTVLAVGHYPPHPGGVAWSCAALFHGMAERGNRVHLIAEGTPETADYDREHQSKAPTGFSLSRYLTPKYFMEFHRVEEARRHKEIISREFRKCLPSAIERRRPDLLVACHEVFCAVVADYAEEFRLPCAFMLRGSPTWQIAQGVATTEVEQEFLETARRADLLIPVGRYMQDRLEERGLNNVHHIPNFLSLKTFRPSPPDPELRRCHAIPDDAVVVLHASTMQPRKRPQDIIKSAAQTLERNSNLIYLFLGGEQYRSRCEELCRGLGLWGSFRFVPSIPNDVMPKYLNLADIVVLASEGEGVARIYLEAQACGRTLVVSDIAAAREVVRDGETGLLFQTGDVDDLAEKTLLAAGKPELRAQIGSRSKAGVGRFDVNRIVPEYISQFGRVLSARSQGDRRRSPP